jgi:hypothetical protein
MLWEQAHRDLEIPADVVDVRAKSRAELEGTVNAYIRVAETAPPDMSRQLGYYRKQAAGLGRQAEHAEADGDVQLAGDSRAAAAEETRQADELNAAQDTRDAWDQAHETKRLAARAARQELDRRGIEPEHRERRKHESLTIWWRQFEVDAQAAERAIERQRQTAIDAGQPWPRKPRATATTPEPGEQKVTERLRQDGRLPGLGLEQKEPQAGIPEPAKPQPEPELQAEPGGPCRTRRWRRRSRAKCRPDSSASMGSFERWARTVGGALQATGIEGSAPTLPRGCPTSTALTTAGRPSRPAPRPPRRRPVVHGGRRRRRNRVRLSQAAAGSA